MIAQRFLQTYAVPKRMYKKDGSVGQSEKYSGLKAKKLSLMKGDKVVKLLQVSAQNSLFGYTWNSYICVSHKFFIKIIYCAASSK